MVAVPTFERIRRLIARFGKVDPLVQIPDRERGSGAGLRQYRSRTLRLGQRLAAPV